jgi:ferrous iron transport protein A
MSSAAVKQYEIEEEYLHLECEEVNKGELISLADGEVNVEYTIAQIRSEDDELKTFLFSLGCFKGETVTIISRLAENFVISIKDARYSIDEDLAQAIRI